MHWACAENFHEIQPCAGEGKGGKRSRGKDALGSDDDVDVLYRNDQCARVHAVSQRALQDFDGVEPVAGHLKGSQHKSGKPARKKQDMQQQATSQKRRAMQPKVTRKSKAIRRGTSTTGTGRHDSVDECWLACLAAALLEASEAVDDGARLRLVSMHCQVEWMKLRNKRISAP
jgi:hypothetical protein